MKECDLIKGGLLAVKFDFSRFFFSFLISKGGKIMIGKRKAQGEVACNNITGL